MHWQYWVRSFGVTDKDGIENLLNEQDAEGWELVTSWTAPGDPHVNRGEHVVYFLLRKSK